MMKISIRLSQELLAKIDKAAAADRRERSDMMRLLLQDAIEELSKKGGKKCS